MALAVYLTATWRYARQIGPFMVDDAFIFLRYADNLVRGHGLVFNPGQPVEGYTSFLWTLLLAGAMRLGLPPLAFAQRAGIALGAVTIALTWTIARRLAPGSWIAAALPAGLLATSRTFCMWAVEGLDTKLFGALLAAAWLALLGPGPRLWRGLPVTGIALGLVALARPEGYLVAAAAALVLVAEARREGRWAPLGWQAVAFGAIVGAHVAFRLATYGAVLPNTFYAKVPGPQAGAGLRWLATLASQNYVWVYAPLPIAGIVAFLRARESRPARLFALALLAAFPAYWVAVGGDYFEFRFADAVLPFWAVVTADGARHLAGAIGPRLRTAAGTVLAGLALGANATTLRHAPRVGTSVTTAEREARFTASFATAGRWLARNIADGESIAVRPAGVIPYLTRAPCLDLLGLNDREIARSPDFVKPGAAGHQREVPVAYARARGVTYYVGHPVLADAPGPPQTASVEIAPGGYFIFLPLVPWARWGPGVHPLGSHGGLAPPWTPRP